MKKFIIFAAMLSIMSCTDAEIASLKSYGDPHKIMMYNGGKLVAEWVSTGKVETMSSSDGWQFMDSKTGTLVRVGGDVIIEIYKGE